MCHWKWFTRKERDTQADVFILQGLKMLFFYTEYNIRIKLNLLKVQVKNLSRKQFFSKFPYILLLPSSYYYFVFFSSSTSSLPLTLILIQTYNFTFFYSSFFFIYSKMPLRLPLLVKWNDQFTITSLKSQWIQGKEFFFSLHFIS